MIFLDSSFIVACKIGNDEHHKSSIDYLAKMIAEGNEEFVTSDYIFDEVVTVILVKSKNLGAAIDAGRTLRIASFILKVDEEVYEKAWEIFSNQQNTKLSFTDCSTLALMQKEGIKNIATFDQDFRKVKEVEVVCS